MTIFAVLQTSNNPEERANNNIDSKRLRLDDHAHFDAPGSSPAPLTPPSFKENNNKQQESLLSQALAEKPVLMNFNNGGGRSDGHDDSGASDTGSERPESMLDGSLKGENSNLSFDLHRSLSSPAAAAAAAAAGLFPPGLEALYRQAGFPAAFLGLQSGNGSGQGGSGSSSASHNVTSSGAAPTYTHVGLQSHANNPSRKY